MASSPKHRVWVTRRLPEEALLPLFQEAEVEVWPERLPPSREVLLEKARGCSGLLTLLTDTIDAEVMDAAGPQLKVISNYAVGFDNIDVAAATQRGIVVTNTPGVLTETTADLAFALLMAAARRLQEGYEVVRRGDWLTWEPQLLLGQDVHGATLGLVGLGRIGQAVARRAKGFSMRILYTDPQRAPQSLEEGLGATWVDFPTLLRESDFISIHCPLTPQTRHLFNAEAFRQMKPTAILINTARGPIVDTQALYEALRQGRLRAAALDVTDPEPLPPDHPLLTLPNCLVVPHIGSASVATRRRMAEMAVANLLAVLRGETPPYPVNPEALRPR